VVALRERKPLERHPARQFGEGMYKLVIMKFVENEDYEKQMLKYEQQNQYRNSYDENNYPKPTKLDRVLEVDLEDDEYKAVREAVIKNWDNTASKEG
jgi:hypothetical protein